MSVAFRCHVMRMKMSADPGLFSERQREFCGSERSCGPGWRYILGTFPALRPLPAPAPLRTVQPVKRRSLVACRHVRVYLYPSLQASQVCGRLQRTCLSCTLRSEGSDSPSWRHCSSTVNGKWPWSVRGTCVSSMFICTLLLESFRSWVGGWVCTCVCLDFVCTFVISPYCGNCVCAGVCADVCLHIWHVHLHASVVCAC